MVNKGKVEQLGSKAQKKAIKLKVEGLTYSAITNELNKEFNSNLKETEVSSFLKRKNKKIFREMKEDKNYQNKMLETYWDTINQLKEINKIMYDFFIRVSKDPEYNSKQVFCPECEAKFRVQLKSHDTFIKAAQVLLAQIKHVDTVIGRLKTGTINITYNFVDLSKKLVQVMPRILETAQRVGIIKNYNKKRLKDYSHEDVYD